MKLRGIDAIEIARATGIGYHQIQKAVKGVAMIRLRNGKQAKRPLPKHVGEAIAAHLGLTYAETFGRQSDLVLRRLILREIAKQAKQVKKDLDALYLTDNAILPETKVVCNG